MITCRSKEENIRTYFEQVAESIGLKCLYSRQEAINLLLENVEDYPIMVVSPISAIAYDRIGRAIIPYEISVVAVCDYDFTEEQTDKLQGECLQLLNKAMHKIYYKDSNILTFERIDSNGLTFAPKYDSHLTGALRNVYLKHKTDICI